MQSVAVLRDSKTGRAKRIDGKEVVEVDCLRVSLEFEVSDLEPEQIAWLVLTKGQQVGVEMELSALGSASQRKATLAMEEASG